MAKLLNGNFKAIDMGVPLVKIENDTIIYVDERLDETRKLQIEYGEVNDCPYRKLFSTTSVWEHTIPRICKRRGILPVVL